MFSALTIDFETRSPVDIKRSSYRQYIRHPQAGIMCVATQFVEQGTAEVWVPPDGRAVFEPGDPCPAPIRYAIEQGIPIYAHNAPFDRRVYRWRACEELGWPDVPADKWRCTAALCGYYALPRELSEVAVALNLPVQKDMEGHRVMMQLTKPKTYNCKQIAKMEKQGIPEYLLPIRWEEDPEKLRINAEYCRRDVETQTCLLRTLGPLPPERLKDWQKDQVINERGAYIDLDSLFTTQAIIETEMKRADTEMQRVTTGITGKPVVLTVNQRDKIMVYLEMQGIDMLALRKADVEEALKREDLGTTSRRVLELRQAAGKASIKKVKALLENIDAEDQRARDALVWHKASTGRWAGARWQPQNLPREAMKDEDADEFHRILRTHPDPPQYYAEKTLGSREDFFAVMSSALRSFVMAPPGRSLLVSDFASIESRVLAWLSGCKPMLGAYHKKECVYSQFAGRIYNRPIEGKGPERQLGKVAVLGLGYGMGERKFIETAATDPRTPDISITEMVRQLNPRRRVWETVEQTKGKIIVDLYRRTYPEIPALWRDSEEAMKMAISTGQPQTCGFLTFGCTYPWAWIRLPSGRFLWYYEPEIKRGPSPFGGDRMVTQITHMTVDGKTKKWVRRKIWGGTIVENCLAGDTRVLTDKGVKPLDQVALTDRVWDGFEWVSHRGLVRKGKQKVVSADGTRMTPDHEVVCNRGWVPVGDVNGVEEAAEGFFTRFNLPDDCIAARRRIYLPGRRRYTQPVSDSGEICYVYDLLDCGPMQRFTVLTSDGWPMMVHNCTQAVAADLLMAAIHRIDETGRYVTVLSVHDEVVAEGEPGTLDEYHYLMTVVPDWAAGCPIEAESHEKRRYGK